MVSAILVFTVLVAGTLGTGFWAWRRHGDLDDVTVWGLGGRRNGAVTSWFLIGATIYTAYTYIAVPALVAGSGAIGFYAVPYAITTTLFIASVAPRFYRVCRERGYLTAGDFVRGETGSRALMAVIAATGILASLPYIALQMYGVEVSVAQFGIHPQVILILTFLILSILIYICGLHAATLMAYVKDVLVALVVLVAAVALPAIFGGWGGVFAGAQAQYQAAHHAALPATLAAGQQLNFATLALGSTLALFMYPHVQTSVLAARDERAVQLSVLWLPVFALLLGLLALFGYVALAAGVKPTQFATVYDPNGVIPALFIHSAPNWLGGVALAALSIGGLVPAAVMSISVGLIAVRNIAPLLRRRAPTAYEAATTAKVTSLTVKVLALAILLFVEQSGVLQFVINLQLMGGVWILQTFPAVLLGLYTRWLHRRALLAGWLVGMALGTWMALSQSKLSTSYPLVIGGQTFVVYVGLAALLANLAASAVVTLAFAALARAGAGSDMADVARETS